MRTWLGHQEDNHRIVLYQADADVSPWTARCIRQVCIYLNIGVTKPPSVKIWKSMLPPANLQLGGSCVMYIVHRVGWLVMANLLIQYMYMFNGSVRIASCVGFCFHNDANILL